MNALRAVDAGLIAHPNSGLLLDTRADVLQARGDYAGAILTLEKAASTNTGAYYVARAALATATERPAETAAQLARIDRAGGNTPWIWWARGRFAELSNDLPAAVAAARRGLTVAPCAEVAAYLHVDIGRWLSAMSAPK